MSDNNGEFGAFLAGFVIGGLVGAATALILAPQSGSEMRTQLVNKSHELRGAGERRIQQVRKAPGEFAAQFADDDDFETSTNSSSQARIILDSGRPSSNADDHNGSASIVDSDDRETDEPV